MIRAGHAFDDELDTLIATVPRRQVAAGVTTVRDLGDRRRSALEAAAP